MHPDSAVAVRLQRLGEHVGWLPDPVPCAHCGDQLGIAPLRISYEITRGDYTLYCESCGHTGDSLQDLTEAIVRWNTYHTDMRARTAERARRLEQTP